MAITKTIEIDVNSLQAVGGLKNLNEALLQVDKSTKGLDASFEEVYGDLKPLTARMGEAEDRLYELALAGKSTSQEYKELLSSVGNYRKVQMRTDMAVCAAATTLDVKLGGALQGASSAFSGIQGVMALTGNQSEDFEEALLKLSGAMALTNGIRGVRESVDSFKQLGSAIKATTAFQKLSAAAQYIWNAAMSANPIGAIIVAITALIVGGYALIKMFKNSSEANEKAAAATKANTLALQNQSKQAEKSTSKLSEYNKYQYDLAKASGASSEQLRKLALKHKDEEIALSQKNTMLARSTFLRERDTLASLKNSNASDEVIKAQEKLTQDRFKEFDKQREGFYKSKQEEVALIRQQNVEVKTEQVNANKTASEKQKEANDKAKELAKDAYNKDLELLKENLANEKLTFDQRRKLVLDNTKLTAEDRIKLNKQINADEAKSIEAHNKAIEDINKKYDDEKLNREADTAVKKEELDYQRKLKEINDLTQTELEKQTLVDKLNVEYNARLIEAKKTDDLKAQEEKIKKLQLDKDYENLSFEEKRAAIKAKEDLLLQDKTLTEQQRNDIEKQYSDARIKIGDLEKQAKEQQLAGIGNALQNMSAIAGESTTAGKAFAVASTAISTYSTAQKAYESAFLPVPTVASPALGAVYAGIAVAGGLMNIKKILSVKTPKGSGGASAPSGGGAPAAPPKFNVVGNSGVNQIAQTLGNQQPVQAFVVANQVTSQQSMDRNIVKNASLG